MSFAIQIDVSDLKPMQKAIKRLAELDFSDLMGNLASEVESQTRERISETKRGPDGRLWKKWSKKYAGSKHGPPSHEPHPGERIRSGIHSILYLEGNLLDSIQSDTAGPMEFEVGSNMIYARRQQADRPFIGLGKRDREDLVDMAEVWLERAFHGV